LEETHDPDGDGIMLLYEVGDLHISLQFQPWALYLNSKQQISLYLITS